MKPLFFLFLLSITSLVKAQLLPLLSGVYNLDNINGRIDTAFKKKVKWEGSTTDLENLSVHVSTLAPGKTNHPPRAINDREELIIVKDGQLTITINDSSKMIGPGSLALIVAGDTQSFQNSSALPVTYYVLGFRSKSTVNIARGKDGGGSLVKDWNELTVKKTAKGESRPVFDRPSSMFTRFETHVTTLNGSQESHPPHEHRAEEIMFLIKGNVIVSMGEEKLKAAPGSLILARPNVLHNVTNAGAEPCTYFAIKWYN
ncbi:MAG: hypothetical protein JWR72_2669 [Flavisolibacter sp.]|nr:hypothetical protein [Flavisolibacter sp.]